MLWKSIFQTPNIDNFYNESLRMTDFHVGPTCAPTRSGLMTGHYANSTGVWHTVGGRSLLRSDEVTLAKALKAASVEVGDQKQIVNVNQEDCEAVLTLSLSKGEKKLYTRFLDKDNECLTAAYYIEVSKID